MTRAEWEELTLDEAIDWADYDYGVHEITFEDSLIRFAKEKIDEDNIGLALHILGAIYNSEEAYCGYYLYDYSLGTISTPTPITCKEDLEDYVTFELLEEPEEEKESYPYIVNVGMEKDNLQPYIAAPTEGKGIIEAKIAQKFYNYTEVVYMPEDDLDTNEVVWRSWDNDDDDDYDYCIDRFNNA